jgi:hypothetical protein
VGVRPALREVVEEAPRAVEAAIVRVFECGAQAADLHVAVHDGDHPLHVPGVPRVEELADRDGERLGHYFATSTALLSRITVTLM